MSQNMSTAESSTGPAADAPEPSISELAQTVADETDDPAVELLAEATKRLAAQAGKTDDFATIVLADRVENAAERLDDMEATLSGLEATQADHDQQLKSFLGPVPGRSKRDKRLADIRTAMIRAAQANDRIGTRWHRYDIEDQLGAHGYTDDEIPSKPQIREDIKTLAEEPGFEETSKPREGKDGVVRNVLALKLVLADLPENGVSNQVTTHAGRGRGATTGENPPKQSRNKQK